MLVGLVTIAPSSRFSFKISLNFVSFEFMKTNGNKNAGLEGIEPPLSVLETEVLPLNDRPFSFTIISYRQQFARLLRRLDTVIETGRRSCWIAGRC